MQEHQVGPRRQFRIQTGDQRFLGFRERRVPVHGRHQHDHIGLAEAQAGPFAGLHLRFVDGKVVLSLALREARCDGVEVLRPEGGLLAHQGGLVRFEERGGDDDTRGESPQFLGQHGGEVLRFHRRIDGHHGQRGERQPGRLSAQALAQALDHRAGDQKRRFRRAFHQLHVRFAREADEVTVVHGTHGGRGQFVGEQGHLAHAFAGQDLADTPLRPVGIGNEDPQPAVHEEIERLAHLALPDQRVAAVQAHPFGPRPDCPQLVLRHTAQQIRCQQQIDGVLSHVPPEAL